MSSSRRPKRAFTSLMLDKLPFGNKKPDSDGGSRIPHPGEVVELKPMNDKILLHDGTTVSPGDLLDTCISGVIIFSYCSASGIECAKQAFHFKNAHAQLTSNGFQVYGISKDHPKLSRGFAEDNGLPFSLICDVNASLIGLLGLDRGNDVARGVVALDSNGCVLVATLGSADKTIEAVRPLYSGDISHSSAAVTPAIAPWTEPDYFSTALNEV